VISPFVLNELDQHILNNDLSIRSKYKTLIIKEVFEKNDVSRVSLEKGLKLRRGTILSVINELLEIGIIIEAKQKNHKQGRPSLLLVPNPDKYVVLSFYIEGLLLRGGIVNLNEEVLFEHDIPIDKNADSQEFIKQFITLWQFLDEKRPKNSIIVSGAFSAIGCVQSDSKIWISTNRWPFIRDIDFKKIEKIVGNEIRLRRNLETVLAYELSRNLVYTKNKTTLIHWGYGIGSAYSYNGEVLKTERGTYTGLGHIQINPNSTKKCQCGDMGCVEAEAALWSIIPCIDELKNLAPEEAVERYDVLSNLNPTKHDCFNSALNYFGAGLKILLKIYSPDYILFLSPFTQNKFVMSLIENVVSETFPATFDYRPAVIGIGTSFYSSIFANAQPLIKETLEALIRNE
jgi:predicted NBD/HSP70 family sugar kinase